MSVRYEKIHTDDQPVVKEDPQSAESEGSDARAQLDFSEFDDEEEGKLSSWTAILFIVGNVVGAGVIAMPYCMKLAGWAAIPLLFVISISFVYAGVLLAKSCADMLESEKRDGSMRDIYPSVAEAAAGKVGRNTVTVFMTITLITSCLIFLLVAGEMLEKVLPVFGHNLTTTNALRVWFIVCGFVLLPFTFLGSPKDFWAVALLAMATSALATVAVIVNLGIAHHDGRIAVHDSVFSAKSLFAAVGILSFGFSGSTIFPSIQNDLKDPKQFYKSVCIGYSIVTFIYVFVPILSYYVLGSNIKEDLLASLIELPVYHTSTVFKTLVITSQAAICIHVMCAFVMNINPVYQQLEAHLNIPAEFGWQRCAVRSTGMFILVCVAVAVPKFGPVLSLSGGTVQVLIGLVAPIVIYALLQQFLPKYLIVIFVAILILCVVMIAGSAIVETGNIIKVIRGTYVS